MSRYFHFVSTTRVLHYFGGPIRKARKELRKNPELIKEPRYARVVVKDVPVKMVQEVFGGKYIPAGPRKNIPAGNR